MVLVSAPAGFGKTTLLTSWLAHARASRDARRLGLPRRGRPGPLVVLDLRRHRPGPGRPRRRRRRRSRCSQAGRAADRGAAGRARQRAERAARRGHAGPRRLPPGRRPGHPVRDDLPGRPPAAAAAAWSSAPAPTRPCRWPGCGPAASSPRSAPPTCGSPPTRRPPTSTTPPAWAWPPRTSRRSRSARRAGSRRCSWPPCRCRAATTPSGFIAGFAGDDRFVVDYLVEEVLDRQPEHGAPVPARDLHPGPAHRLRCATP